MYALVIVVLLAVFSLVSWQVDVEGPVLRADTALREAAARRTAPGGPLTTVARACADLGNALVAGAPLAACACVLAWRRRSFAPPALAVLAAALVPALVLPLKEAFGRTGPDGLPLYGYAGYYPSGHALTAVVAYGTTALLYARLAPQACARYVRAAYAYAAAGVLGLCTGVGLVLGGYHWASDVVASWALGGLVLCALAALVPLSPLSPLVAGPGGAARLRAGAGRGALRVRRRRASRAPGSADR